MEILIPWLLLSIIAAVIANNKGRSGLGFFLLALLLSPLIGILAALIVTADVSKVEESKISSGEKKKCPFCAELVKAEAIVCKHCGRDLPSESQKVKTKDSVNKRDIIDNYDGTFHVYGKQFTSRVEARHYLEQVDKNIDGT